MMTWNSMFFQSPSTFMMEMVSCMYEYVSMILGSIFVMVVFFSLKFLFSKSFAGSFFEHHELETVWTIIPMVILIFIILPSLESLYMLDSCSFCGLSISVMGHQWYWSYYFKDFQNFFFDSYMITDNSIIRLLDVDNRLIVPSNIPIRVLLSSSDVIHSWTIPSFGVKMDAIPGRINQFCFSVKRSGIYFGQCSEICGANHSFMPIVVESIPLKSFIIQI